MLAATTLVADSWHHGHAWWPLLWLFWLVLIGALVFFFTQRRRGSEGKCPTLCVGMTKKERHVYEDRNRSDR